MRKEFKLGGGKDNKVLLYLTQNKRHFFRLLIHLFCNIFRGLKVNLEITGISMSRMYSSYLLFLKFKTASHPHNKMTAGLDATFFAEAGDSWASISTVSLMSTWRACKPHPKIYNTKSTRSLDLG